MRIPPINTGSRYKISINAFSHCDFTSCNFLLLTENVIKETTTTVRIELYIFHANKKLHNFPITFSSSSPRIYAATLENFSTKIRIDLILGSIIGQAFDARCVSSYLAVLLATIYTQNLAPEYLKSISSEETTPSFEFCSLKKKLIYFLL
jgi:hypothetical protein